MDETIGKSNANKIFLVIIIILALLVIGLSIFLFSSLNNSSSPTGYIIKDIEGKKLVTKILDGDTIIIEGGYSIRLLGIDADEKGYPCYSPAQNRLEELVLNKEVYLEADKENQDQYQRYLRYLILNGENINLKLVREGFAIARFSPENTKYQEKIINAEKQAMEDKVGCKWGEIPTSPLTSLPKEINSNAIGACNAGNYVGEEKIVAGKVADGYKSKTNTVFLNFEKPYPNHCFTAVIFSSDLINFPENPQDYYGGKIIEVKGLIKEYLGKPEIILKDRSQIKIVT